jgi:hypothetical protein
MSSNRRPIQRSATRSLYFGLASILLGLLAAGSVGCGQAGEGPDDGIEDPQSTPEPGESSFHSAAGQNGQATEENNANGQGDSAGAAAPDSGSAERGEPEREIQEGDIYRVVDHSSQILNLNHYRGLQIVDFSNPEEPNIIGRARISGEPVEMYLVGDQVYALLNNWRGYYAGSAQKQLMPQRYQGGVVAVIDISDPTNPEVTERTRVPGDIETSRLTRGNGEEALFVVADEGGGYGRNSGDPTTYLRSFDVSGRGKLAEQSKLDLGGNVADIQGADNHLMVARHDDSGRLGENNQGSKVSIIDISDPSGTMHEGDQVTVDGRVQNKHNMDLHDDILRVVSGAAWDGSRKNHIETYDASDIDNLKRVDHASFAPEERLEATLFMEDRAFVVTFQQIDPFFTFSIGANGQLDEKSEFEVSGWNDYFVPVADNDRMVGIGMNNEEGFTMAASLYDASNLTNPQPMIDRHEVELDYSRSEANRDDRAFTVLENATNVKTEDGTVETGLVLLPFNGWDGDADEHVSGVQIFSFSKNTLTRRGTMEHGTPVRRSFSLDRSEETTANLSEAELSIFDTDNPDSPAEKGRVELAPNYTSFWAFDEYGVRRNSRDAYYGWYHRETGSQQTDSLEVVPLGGHPDKVEAETTVPIPADAQVFRSGDHLVVAEAERTGDKRHKGTWKEGPVWKTDLQIWDFSDATSPTPVQTVTTEKLRPHREIRPGRGGVGYGHPSGPPRADVAASGAPREPYRRSRSLTAHPVGGDLVFVSTVRERDLKGTVHTRSISVDHNRNTDCYGEGNQQCTYYRGSIQCQRLVRPDGTEESEECSGKILRCVNGVFGGEQCDEVDPSEAPTTENTYEYERYDSWRRYRFHTLDTSNPAQMSVTAETEMPTGDRDVSYLVDGSDIYVTHRESYDKPNDSRAYYRYYYRKVDYASPASPAVGEAVNVPGKLIAVDGDHIVTRDYLWGDEIVETSINKLEVREGAAYLQASHRLEDRRVEQVALDGSRHALVSHRLAWRARDGGDNMPIAHGGVDRDDDGTYTKVLDLGSGMEVLSDPKVADWATLKTARDGKALFSVPGGMMVADLANARQPVAQAYFPLRGGTRDLNVREDGTVYLAAGRYGLYRFGLDQSNLLVR